MRTMIHASIGWESLCRMAKGLTNAGGEERGQFLGDRVYMAVHSIGGRLWDVDEWAVPHLVADDTFRGCWRGWAEANSHEFEWESATSGAKLWAYSTGPGYWILQYEGPPSRDEESNYLLHFLEEVDLDSLEVDEVKSLLNLQAWCQERRGSGFCDQKVAEALARLEAAVI